MHNLSENGAVLASKLCAWTMFYSAIKSFPCLHVHKVYI